jgi:hypothetical protein
LGEFGFIEFVIGYCLTPVRKIPASLARYHDGSSAPMRSRPLADGFVQV